MALRNGKGIGKGKGTGKGKGKGEREIPDLRHGRFVTGYGLFCECRKVGVVGVCDAVFKPRSLCLKSSSLPRASPS